MVGVVGVVSSVYAGEESRVSEGEESESVADREYRRVEDGSSGVDTEGCSNGEAMVNVCGGLIVVM